MALDWPERIAVLPRRFHPAFFFFVAPVIALSWWLMPRPTPASPARVRPVRPAEAPFGVWRGHYTLRPAGLWDETGSLELRVTRRLVEDTILARG